MLRNRQYRLVLSLLLVLCCHIVRASTARWQRRLFAAPTRTEKPDQSLKEEEKRSSTSENEDQKIEPQNKNATRIKHVPQQRESDNSSNNNETTTRKPDENIIRMTQPETKKPRIMPDWALQFGRTSQKNGKEADSSVMHKQQVRYPWPESSVTNSSLQVDRNTVNKEKKDARVGDVHRGWPSWFPVEPRKDTVMEEMIAQSNCTDAHLTWNETKEKSLGWPSWFPLKKNNETIVSSQQAMTRENSKEDLVSTKEAVEYETESAMDGRKVESRAPVSVSLPSINVLRTIRDRFRQSRRAMEEEQQDLHLDKSRSQEKGLDDHKDKMPNGTKSQQTRIASSFLSLQESVMNATTFIRRLPWRPIGNERIKKSDSRETKVSPDRNETTKAVVQSEDTSKQRDVIQVDTERRQSDSSSKRVEPMAPINERQRKLGALNPLKAFKFVRNLPWTPKKVDPSLTKQTQKQDTENKDTPSDDVSEKNLQLAQGPALPVEHSKAAEDETELIESEIEDILSKYVEHNEDSIASEEDNEDVLEQSREKVGEIKYKEQSRAEMGVTKYKVTDSIHTYAERHNKSDDDENENSTRNRSLEEPAEPARRFGNNNVESVGQRQEPKKRDNLLNPSESDEAFTDNSTPSSNTTSAPKQIDEQSPERSTQESAPSTNTTPPLDAATPRQQEDQRPQQQYQQPTMIIMGGPHDGRPMSGTPNVARPPAHSSSILLAEAIVSIVGASVRIWLLRFLAKWWSEEEILRPVQHFVWERLNDWYQRDDTVLENVMQLPPANISERQWRRYLRRQHRAEGKVKKKQVLQPKTFQRTVIVLEIKGELNLPHLEQAVTFILSQQRKQAFGSIGGLAKELEVVLLIESPGGAVTDFGLAAAQVERLSREAGLTVTACVDKIAASGGYMIASQAHSILAAPFGIVGSIGVIREGINIHDALQKYGIKGLVLKAGDYKVPLTMLGKVTNTEMAKAQHTLDTMHKAFQQLVARGRPQLEENIDDVCNGDIYFGENAKRLSLVDRIVTSEEYLLERIQAGDRVMKLHRAHQYVVGRRKLIHPLDFLRERSVPLRAACARWLRSDLESTLSGIVAATGVMGAIQFLVQNIIMRGRDSGFY